MSSRWARQAGMTELSLQGPHPIPHHGLLWGLATGQGRGDRRACALGVLS